MIASPLRPRDRQESGIAAARPARPPRNALRRFTFVRHHDAPMASFRPALTEAPQRQPAALGPPGQFRAAPLPLQCWVPPVRVPGQDFHLRSQHAVPGTPALASPTGSASQRQPPSTGLIRHHPTSTPTNREVEPLQAVAVEPSEAVVLTQFGLIAIRAVAQHRRPADLPACCALDQLDSKLRLGLELDLSRDLRFRRRSGSSHQSSGRYSAHPSGTVPLLPTAWTNPDLAVTDLPERPRVLAP